MSKIINEVLNRINEESHESAKELNPRVLDASESFGGEVEFEGVFYKIDDRGLEVLNKILQFPPSAKKYALNRAGRRGTRKQLNVVRGENSISFYGDHNLLAFFTDEDFKQQFCI